MGFEKIFFLVPKLQLPIHLIEIAELFPKVVKLMANYR